MRALVATIATVLACAAIAQSHSWSKLVEVLGNAGEPLQGGCLRFVSFRTELQIQNSAGMLIPPEMGLCSSIVFRGTDSDATVSGEMCVLRHEIDNVLDILLTTGIEVVALGSRLSGEQPTAYFLSFEGKGEAVHLASAFKKALGELGKERMINEGLKRTGEFPVVDWKSISTVLGSPVKQLGSTRVWRAEPASGSWLTFGGCPCGRTMLLGKLVVARQELRRTIGAIRKKNISVTAIAPMLGDSVEIGLEGEGDAIRLAGSMREVIRTISG
jgi:hypothetical protein